jgi:hypothetical protein
MMVEWFGDKLSLQKDLSFALQFAKLEMDQLIALQKYDIPEQIEALDAQIRKGLSETELADLEYQFRVIYTLDNASKSQAGIHFIVPGTEEAKEIKNVLIKYKMADEDYPYKPTTVAKLVSEKTNKKFTTSNNSQAWSLYKVRPKKGAKQPENTNKEFCIFHPAHADYTYSKRWVDFLCDKIFSEAEFNKIKAVKL